MSPPETVRVFAPASVGNAAVGFDVLGFALEAPGDTVTARRRRRLPDEEPVRLVGLTGDGGRLPRDPAANTATVAARAVLERGLADRTLDPETGLDLSLHKGLPLASGLGSSAASAVAGALAADALLGLELPRAVLLEAAGRGEAVASGEGLGGGEPAEPGPHPSVHLDNVAPCLWGGFTLVRPSRGPEDPPEVIPLPVPEGDGGPLTAAVVHPHQEVATRDARRVLPREIPLATAILQWGHLGAFVAALHRGDLDLLERSLVDRVAEPARAHLVEGFRQVQAAGLEAGALGVSLSGAGPSVFALCRSPEAGRRAGQAMVDAFHRAGHEADLHLSPVAPRGARVVER